MLCSVLGVHIGVPLSVRSSGSSRWSKTYRPRRKGVDGEKGAVGLRSEGGESQAVSGRRTREILSTHQERYSGL